MSQRLRVWLVNLWLVAALLLFALVANQHYPLRHWLCFTFLRAWAGGLLLVAASLSGGLLLARQLLPPGLRLGERLVLGFALGVLLFVFGVVAGGLLHLFGAVFFFAWPALLLALGARESRATCHQIARLWRRFGLALVRPRGPIEVVAAALLLVSLAFLYLEVITPTNLGADAHWYHLPMAEHYATSGRIAPFAEGWYLGAYPQLASLIYTWAFQTPGQLIDHVALASHLEWLLFLATLAGLAPLVRRLIGVRVPFAAAALFAFPGVFLYDSSLLTMADHVLAFWAVPVALATLLLARRWAVRPALAAGLLTGGPLLTKYQGIYFLAPAAIAVVVLTVRQRRARGAGLALLAWGGALLVGTSPHWLKNLVFYGDPLYPLLHRFFPSHPFSARAAEILKKSYFPPQFALHGTPAQQALRSLGALFNFSFTPNDWFGFHHDRPVFGSLFTLLLPALLFARAPRRLWWLIASLHLGLLVWYVTSHQDRFLQGLLPLLAACCAAAAVLIWRVRAARLPLALLFGYQLLACADVPFLRSHAMVNDSPVKAAVDLIAAGQKQEYERRFHLWGTLEDLGRAIPKAKDTRVLVHDFTEKLGLGVPAVVDGHEWQGAIDYFALATPRDVFALWRRLGVTHAAWRPSRGALSPEDLAREAVFAATVGLYGRARTEIAGYGYAPVADNPTEPRAARPALVAWLGCGGDPPTALYTAAGLAAKEPQRELGETELASAPDEALADAAAIVFRPSCHGLEAAAAELNRNFVKITTAGDVAVWVRPAGR